LSLSRGAATGRNHAFRGPHKRRLRPAHISKQGDGRRHHAFQSIEQRASIRDNTRRRCRARTRLRRSDCTASKRHKNRQRDRRAKRQNARQRRRATRRNTFKRRRRAKQKKDTHPQLLFPRFNDETAYRLCSLYATDDRHDTTNDSGRFARICGQLLHIILAYMVADCRQDPGGYGNQTAPNCG
jgi:hypothetical protein